MNQQGTTRTLIWVNRTDVRTNGLSLRAGWILSGSQKNEIKILLRETTLLIILVDETTFHLLLVSMETQGMIVRPNTAPATNLDFCVALVLSLEGVPPGSCRGKHSDLIADDSRQASCKTASTELHSKYGYPWCFQLSISGQGYFYLSIIKYLTGPT